MKILFLGLESNILYKELLKIENEMDILSTKITKEDVINYEFIISFGYNHIIKKEVIDLFKNNNIINLHISYLPYNRGADPNLWSILENTPSGVTIHLVDKGLDTGDILLQERVFFDYNTDTLETSYNKLMTTITNLFLSNWDLLKNNKILTIPQYNHNKSLHYLKNRPDYNILLPDQYQTKLVDIVSNYKKFFQNNNDTSRYIPYGKQTIDNNDISAVLKVFEENEMLTTGKYVPEFEKKICKYTGVQYGLAVNSGTAALHLATYALNIQEDDEVIVPAISFVASSNCVLYQRGTPVFCDIDPNTLCIDVNKIESLITSKTKAIIFVDMCGQPCQFDEIKKLADQYKLYTIQDAAHSIGAIYKERKVGSYADITCFSFHPVKNLTTCEGGMMVTNNEEFYKRGLSFRTHGISRDFKEREKAQSHYYEMQCLGFNYRIPDVLCALGIEQLKKLDTFVQRRNEIATKYDAFFKDYVQILEPLRNYRWPNLDGNQPPTYKHHGAYHIYIIQLKLENIDNNRDEIFKKLKEAGIGVNVHYMPIYLHPYYETLGYKKGLCPESEKCYDRIITLPIFPLLKDEDIEYVCNTLVNVIR